MTRTTLLLAIAATTAPALAPAPAWGQKSYVYTSASRPGWIGVGYDLRWIQHRDSCQPQVVVDAVVQGAPADRAGLRPGDAILALNGESVAGGRLQWLTGRLEPGDSISLRVTRGGQVREIVAVADLRPDRPPTITRGDDRESEFFSRSRAPLVAISGDTLIARNLDPGSPGRSRPSGFWVVSDDGRTDYRRLERRGGGTLERRVTRLLACADSITRFELVPTRAPATASATGTVTLRQIQIRADSLRRLMAARALTHAETHPLEIMVEEVRQDADGQVRVWRSQVEDGAVGAVFRFDDHTLFADRGVAGAELVEMEPELAAYFRNARRGVLVLRVSDDSPADRAGLEPGDVIVGADGREIESVTELRRLFTLPDASGIELRVIRHGRNRSITIPRS